MPIWHLSPHHKELSLSSTTASLYPQARCAQSLAHLLFLLHYENTAGDERDLITLQSTVRCPSGYPCKAQRFAERQSNVPDFVHHPLAQPEPERPERVGRCWGRHPPRLTARAGVVAPRAHHKPSSLLGTPPCSAEPGRHNNTALCAHLDHLHDGPFFLEPLPQEQHTVRLTGAKLLKRGEVRLRAIAFMHIKAIRREFLVELFHISIAGHFRGN